MFNFQIRLASPDETAALFVVHAAIEPTDAGQLLAWTQEMEARLESGGRAWVVAQGRKLAGYAAIDPLPGLPGVFELTGGIVPALRRQGLGTRLLRHVQTAAAGHDVRQSSCRVERLDDESATFLLRRDFIVEHEECLLQLADLTDLPAAPEIAFGKLAIFPRDQAIATFLRVYDESFTDTAWSQPYSKAEVAAALAQPEELLFAVVDGRPVGVVWHEVLAGGRGRVEPLGIARDYQGRGLGRWLLLAALRNLRQRGANSVEIGVWRSNHPAMQLYRNLGFVEVDNWFFLAFDIAHDYKEE